MELIVNTLLHFLDGMASNAVYAAELRGKALCISASFSLHKNVGRLMAQVTALTRGEEYIYPSHRVYGPTESADTPVCRYSKVLQAIMADHRIKPSISDIKGHSIQLISILDPAIEKLLQGENYFELHQALIRAEKKANEDLAELTKNYGYHYVFRIGLMEYYMVRTIVENINFLRPEYPGDVYRVCAQTCPYDAMEKRLNLNAAEKELIIGVVDCHPDDAHRFWDWLERHHVAYNVMKACIALLNKMQCAQ
ncbi:putative mating locus protein [Aspergillus sclerotioniger CBS 115572]|uniref:Putative mating locus protein n=1 Tax=Aspergillus sclerotioniger CBS 115572 TaxID=1450535 RepID=A0A317VYH5_9EURO|nr:putative mating locus protein [Aspergillus sclerotioniger CBS 115572]PWY79414.1 putative mating locus protein [Aspergillus sclerotioniger CBS 115572]